MKSARKAASKAGLDALLTLGEFELAAGKVLSKMTFDYFRGGADGELSLRANASAFERYSIWHRVLVDVSRRSTTSTLFGQKLAMPILVAPMAHQMLAHTQGEPAAARAAAKAGTIYVASTIANCALEEIAQASPGPKWFQVYVHKDREATAQLMRRAKEAGYQALVLTVDVPILGRRLADIRNTFALPKGLTMANFAPFAGKGTGSQLAEFFHSRHDESLSWRDLAWLKSVTGLPLLLKGVVRPDDAKRALDYGVSGIIVSNHGGRQLDGSVAPVVALPAVVEAVKGRVPVLLDGGIRWGTDVLKALALGAQAVLVGRPVLWGLALDGESGVSRVLEILREELDRAMALAGCPRVADITRDLLGPA